jgi:hypothetical protein
MDASSLPASPSVPEHDERDSVANRPKFWAQNAKAAAEKSPRPRKSAAELSADFTKYDRKGAELFMCVVYLKSLIIFRSRLFNTLIC